jgi:hypothetical protein
MKKGDKRPPFSDEWKHNLSVSKKGVRAAPFTDEYKKHLSEAHKGIPSPKKGMIFVPIDEQKMRKREYKRRWNSEHPEKLREYDQKDRIKNHEKKNLRARERYHSHRDEELARHRMESYGIDNATYFEMVVRQDGKCIICGDVPNINLSIDHNHLTGKIRGLICNLCNIAIAKAKDSPKILRAMADYLEKFDA